MSTLSAIFTRLSRHWRCLLLLSGFFVSCTVIITGYVRYARTIDATELANHALIISDDIWAMNEAGASSYLQLVTRANNYRYLAVSIPGDEHFLRISSPPPTGITGLLHKLRLISVRMVHQPLYHLGEYIGTLYGEQYVTVIIPIFNIIIFLLFVLLVALFIFYQLRNRHILEQQIQERTNNLMESKQRFHDLVNQLPEIVLETDQHGRISYANRTARQKLGIHVNEEESSPTVCFPGFIADSPHNSEELFAWTSADEEPRLSEYSLKDREGKTFPVLIRTAPLHRSGSIYGTRMVVIDISQRRRLEDQLNRDQKMKAIGLMAGGVAHDLNNILSGVISYPELLMLDLPEESHMRPPLQAIRQAGLDAAEVVSDLLTVARGIATPTELIHPNELINNYLNSVDFQQIQRNHPEIRCTTILQEGLPYIKCSSIHVRKCLMNLVVNGMEAINGEGKITLTTDIWYYSPSSTLAPTPHFPAVPDGTYLRIRVQDSGSGISGSELEQIFEPFYTKKILGRSGTGLGLTVVWNIMQEHGGTVLVESPPTPITISAPAESGHPLPHGDATAATGTCFTLLFPPGEGAPDNQQKKQRRWQELRGNQETILVIDDDHRQVDIARQLLLSLNYQVVTAASGEEAISFLQENPERSIDLLMLDMIMPAGLNGRETYEKILSFRPGQRAIIVSGFAEDEDVKHTLQLGALQFLSKPYTLEVLGSTVNSAIRQPEQQTSGSVF